MWSCLKAPLYSYPLVAVAFLSAGAWWLCAAESQKAVNGVVPVSGSSPGATLVRHAVNIKSGPATPTVLTNALTHTGEPVPVACSTCHATRVPDLARRRAEEMKDFHQGLAYKHGDQTCLSCHNAANYDTLHRADGTSVDYPRVIELCAQCHGPQHRDFQAGAHGGMNGYWDLARGPRERNTCVSCHDPHAPAYPKVRPVFAPVDRGARQQQSRELAHEAKESAHE